MKVKELLDLVNNVEYVCIDENHTYEQYNIDDVPEQYNKWTVKQIDVCYKYIDYEQTEDLVLWLEVEE